MTTSCVYILECQGKYKIGKTINLNWRISELQAGTPFKLNVFYTIYTEQYSVVEGALHKLFASKRTTGEWFDLSDDDLEFIKSKSVDEILQQASMIRRRGTATRSPIMATWPLPWETIHVPDEFITPIKLIDQAFSTGNAKTLLASFILIFNLGWEADYKHTPPINETELVQYLRLGRRQYYAQKSAMEKLGWFTVSRVGDGSIQFHFDESILTDGDEQ